MIGIEDHADAGGSLGGGPAQALAGLLEAAVAQTFAAGDVIIQRGAEADAAFVLIDGSADVTTVDGDGAEVVLAALTPGSLFGADALLAAPGTTRSATVTTPDGCAALVIDRADFVAVVESDEQLAAELAADGQAQAAQRTILRSPVYHLLSDEVSAAPAGLAGMGQSFEPDAALMTEGDPADGLYIITTGSVTIFKTIDDVEIRLGEVLPGGVVGELAVLDDAPRAATVKAGVETEAIFVPRDRLLEGDATEARAYFANLRRTYEIPDLGLVSQHLAEFEGSAALRTTYELAGDRQVVCHAVTDPGLHHIQVVRGGEVVESDQVWSWHGDGAGIDLGVDGRGIPVEARLHGSFDDFRLLYRCVLADLPLPESTAATLIETGRLELDKRRISRLDDDEICSCMSVTEVQINRVARTYKPNLEQLQDMLGCGTVCGSCIDEVEDLLNQ